MKMAWSLCVLVGMLSSLAAPARGQTAVGTSFAYQGQLNDGGGPATGSYDFQYRLYDAATGGAQIGATLTSNDIALMNGVFTDYLDFGNAAYSSDARWLEISVRPGASVGSYTTLAPRQRLRAAPFAVQALKDANWSASGGNIWNTNSGNTGINVSSPIAKLHVRGSTAVAHLDASDLTTDQVVIEGGQAWLGLYSDEVGAPASGISLSQIDSTTGALSKWSLVQRTSGSGNDFSITYGSDPAGNANPRFLQVKSSGDVAIGVDNPSARLHVKAIGTQSFVPPASFRAASEYPTDAGTSTEYIQFAGNEMFAMKDSATATLEMQQSGGAVRIGPLNTLLDSPKLIVSRNAGLITDSNLDSEDVLIHDTGTAWLGLYSDNSGNVGSGITLAEYGLTQYKWAMYARTTTNVGDFVITFGTNTNPTANDVMFQIDRDGTTKVKVLEILGADVAERFPTAEKLEPGAVVMIDAARPGELCLARGAYNTKVAGVISGAGNLPVGAILGNLPDTPKESTSPVALSGRVWTLCDATDAAIAPGDLLTTADTPGHAMKAVDKERRDGATLGKAMSALERGRKGLVLVLVNLQ